MEPQNRVLKPHSKLEFKHPSLILPGGSAFVTYLGARPDTNAIRRERVEIERALRRLRRELALNDMKMKVAGMRVKRSTATETRPLQPAERRIVSILVDLSPLDGDPVREKTIFRRAEAKLKAEHNGAKLTRSVFRNALDYVRDGRLPRRRP
jgi:hypothetical protein